jgi:hypothetical protein
MQVCEEKAFRRGDLKGRQHRGCGGISDSGALPHKAAIATFPHRLSDAGVTLLFKGDYSDDAQSRGGQRPYAQVSSDYSRWLSDLAEAWRLSLQGGARLGLTDADGDALLVRLHH